MTSISVIVPAYNEGPGLGAHLVSLSEQFSVYGCYDVQYVLVNDGSTDVTADVLAAFARFRKSVTVVTHDRNYGLGRALRSGIAKATGDYVIVVDADLSYSPAVAMELLEVLERENGDIALASAYMRGGSVANVPFLRRFLSREANRLLSLATKGRYATLTCMVRAYRTAVLKAIPFRSDGMDANAEILLTAVRKGANIVEIPARLEWSEDRVTTRRKPNILKIARQSWSTAKLAFSHRPALLLAIPGLVPGSWPLVVGILLLMHASAKTLAIGSAAILFVQYASLAIFAGQMGQFFTSGFLQSRAARSKVYHS